MLGKAQIAYDSCHMCPARFSSFRRVIEESDEPVLLPYNLDMMNIRRLLRGSDGGWLGSDILFGSIMVAAGLSGLGMGDSTAAAQPSGPCALVTTDDVQPLASRSSVADGVSTSLEGVGFSTCRYTWGDGMGRFTLDVTVSEASRMFAGMSPDLIKQGLQASVRAGTADEVISGAGEAAAFKADSPIYVHAAAYVKGRMVEVQLDGFDARDKKDQVIALLKSAASKF